MSRRRKHAPDLDLEEILDRSVVVKIDNVETKMEPFEAMFERCANSALKGDIRACIRFINWCLREHLIAPAEPFDDHVYRVVIPKDWDDDEFMAMYDRFGPPPWPGERDGLTSADREERRAALKHKRRRRS